MRKEGPVPSFSGIVALSFSTLCLRWKNVLSSDSFLQTSSLILLCEIRTEGIDLLAAQAPFQRWGVNLLDDSISPESAQGSKPAANFLRYTGIGSILSGKKAYRRVWVQYRDSAFKNSLPAILSCVRIAFRPLLFLSWKRRQEQSLLIHLFANLLVGYPVTRIGLWSSYHPAVHQKSGRRLG